MHSPRSAEGMLAEQKQTQPVSITILDPDYFTNRIFYTRLDQEYELADIHTYLNNIKSEQYFLHTKKINNRFIGFFDLFVIRNKFSFLDDIDDTIIKSCTLYKTVNKVSFLLKSRTCRSVLDPNKFDNETFWNLVPNHALIRSRINQLIFNQRTIYPFLEKEYFCYYPELKELVITLSRIPEIQKINLSDLLKSCALEPEFSEEIDRAVATSILDSGRNEVYKPSINNDTECKILGLDDINKPPFIFYLDLLPALLSAGLGVSAIIIAITALNILSLALIPSLVMTFGVACVVLSGFLFKPFDDEYQQHNSPVMIM